DQSSTRSHTWSAVRIDAPLTVYSFFSPTTRCTSTVLPAFDGPATDAIWVDDRVHSVSNRSWCCSLRSTYVCIGYAVGTKTSDVDLRGIAASWHLPLTSR